MIAKKQSGFLYAFDAADAGTVNSLLQVEVSDEAVVLVGLVSQRFLFDLALRPD